MYIQSIEIFNKAKETIGCIEVFEKSDDEPYIKAIFNDNDCNRIINWCESIDDARDYLLELDEIYLKYSIEGV